MSGEGLVDLKMAGIWKGDLKQQRRIMETFACTAGDKPPGDYTPLDAAVFKKGISNCRLACSKAP